MLYFSSEIIIYLYLVTQWKMRESLKDDWINQDNGPIGLITIVKQRVKEKELESPNSQEGYIITQKTK